MANFLSTAQNIDYLAPYARRNVGTGGVLKGALGGAGFGSMVGGAIPGAASKAISSAAGLGGLGMGLGTMGLSVGAGALIGGIHGAINKHAASAQSDISAQDARAAVARAYSDAYGGTKQATPEFLDQALAGGGSKWAGAKEVQNAIANIQANAAREQGGTLPGAASGGGGGRIGYQPGNQLLDAGNKAALLRILGGA